MHGNQPVEVAAPLQADPEFAWRRYSPGLRAELIDPRGGTSESTDPTYRVFFWSDDGGTCEEWELSEVDLDEVLAWIPSRSAGRTHSLWAVTREPSGAHLVRLRGIDPPAPPETWPRWARLERR